MKIIKLSFLFSVAIMFSLCITSCGGDDGPGDVDCNSSLAVNNAVSDELDAISNVLNVYINDPSEANCDDLKKAYQNYIDALKGLEDCFNDAGAADEFVQSLAEAEASIDNLIC